MPVPNLAGTLQDLIAKGAVVTLDSIEHAGDASYAFCSLAGVARDIVQDHAFA
ncbi:hypothetical protein D3C85_1840370 [compost metagenome]